MADCRHGNELADCYDCYRAETRRMSTPPSRDARPVLVAKCPGIPGRAAPGGYLLRVEEARLSISHCPCGAPLARPFVLEAGAPSPATPAVLEHAPNDEARAE